MDRLETMLSDTLTEHAQRAPTGPIPLTKRVTRGRNTVAVLAACLIVIAAASIVLALHASAPDHPSHQGQPAIQLNLPAGIRLASFGPVSVRVPAGLPTRTSLCGGPVTHEVLASDDGDSLCPVATFRLARHPGTVIWFSSFQEATPYAAIPTTHTQADGHPARIGYTTSRPALGAGVSAFLVLPEQRIRMGVTAPSRPAVDKVLSSIRIAQTDPLGCAATLGAATLAPAGPTDVLIQADPSTAVRCEYGISPLERGQLVGSYALGPANTRRLTSALNELDPDPCRCVHGGTPAPGHDEVIYFRYADGHLLRINGTLGANLDTYTNQTRTVANFDGSIGHLLAKLTNQR